MNHEFPTALQRYVSEAFAASWTSFGLTTIPSQLVKHKFTDAALAAVIGVQGDGIIGTLIVVAEPRLLYGWHPMGEAAKCNAALAADWLGELANLTIGGINSCLGQDGCVIRISPPSVETGATLVLRRYAQAKPSQRFWLTIDGESVCCQLSADLKPGLELGKGAA